MGQGDIINYLKKNKLATTTEIAEGVGVRRETVIRCLKVLKRYNEIKIIKKKERGKGTNWRGIMYYYSLVK